MDKKTITEYYDTLGKNGEPTHPDLNYRQLEIKAIEKYIDPSDIVLDIGSGDGFTTHCLQSKCQKIIGIDVSKVLLENARFLYPNIDFVYHDITQPLKNISTNEGLLLNPTFTKIISERCLINIPSWEQQKKAIKNIHNLLDKNNSLIMVECFNNGLDRENILRKELGLRPDKVVERNLFFDMEDFEVFIEPFFKIEKKKYFGVYHLISRCVHPALVFPDEPRYDARINDIARVCCENLPYGLEGFGHNVLYVLKKL